MSVIIDCKTWTGKAAAHESLKTALEFPDWYGRNADALYDLLTEHPYQVTLKNLAAARENMGGDLEVILNVMRDANALEAVYEGEMPGKKKCWLLRLFGKRGE